MSKKKNLEWICRRCIKQHLEAEIEHSTELLKTCSFCGTENWCFPVTLSRPVKGGKKAPKENVKFENATVTLTEKDMTISTPDIPVLEPETLKEVIDEARIANSKAIATHILDPETGTNTTDALVFEPLVVPNAPVTNELESAGKFVETAPEAESAEENEALEEAVDEALEAVIEEAAEIEKEPEETPLEAEPEPSNILSGDIDVGPYEAKIAELEAKMAELRKKK